MATLTISVTDLSVSAASDTTGATMIQVADFETIFLRFQGPMTHFITRAVGNREQAFDLVQDVFVKVYKALLGGTVIPHHALVAWLYRIAANTIVDTLRRQHLITWFPLSLFDEDPGEDVLSATAETAPIGFHAKGEADERSAWMATSRVLQKQGSFTGAQFEERVADRQIIEGVFQQMSPKYRTCLWLHEHEGFSCPEIAEILHISISATKMRLRRAREQFLTLYQREIGCMQNSHAARKNVSKRNI